MRFYYHSPDCILPEIVHFIRLNPLGVQHCVESLLPFLMKNPAISLRTSDINGHFDPKSLSIAETLESSAWKNKIYSLFGQDDFGLNDSVQSLREARKISQEISDSEFIADLTNRHEQRHFKDYVSSELGILLTFVFQLRADVIHSYICTKKEVLLSYFPIYNTIIDSLYGSNCNQQDAVDALNLFYRHEFSGIDYDIFKTETPEAPCSPSPLFRFQNILEASAILSEISLIQGRLDDDNAAEAIKLLRLEARDADLYFGLISLIFTEIPCTSAISILIRYSLDSRVPILGSPLCKPINWHDFHPGYRLLNFTKALKEILIAEGWDLAFHAKQGFKGEYYIRFQQTILNFTHYAGKRLGKLDMWDNDQVARYDMNSETLLCKLTEKAQQNVRLNIDQWGIILDHLYESHNTFKKARSENALRFYTDAIVAASDLEIAEVNNWPPDVHAYALFTVVDGYVGSVQKTLDWVNAFFRMVQIEVDEMVMDGISAQDIYDQVVTRYKVVASPILQDMYTNTLKEIISQYHSL